MAVDTFHVAKMSAASQTMIATSTKADVKSSQRVQGEQSGDKSVGVTLYAMEQAAQTKPECPSEHLVLLPPSPPAVHVPKRGQGETVKPLRSTQDP